MLYNELLCTVANNPGVTRNVLYLLSDSPDYCEKVFYDALSAGHIRKICVSYKEAQKRKGYVYENKDQIFLTVKGLRYIAVNSNEQGWEKFIDRSKISHCSLFGIEKNISRITRNNMSKISEANVFFKLCGVQVLTQAHTFMLASSNHSGKCLEKSEGFEGVDCGNSQFKIIREAIKKYNPALLNESIADSLNDSELESRGYRFLPKTAINKIFGLGVNDAKACKYSGILDGPDGFYMVYLPDGDGFYIPPNMRNKDNAVSRLWKFRWRHEKGYCFGAILLVSDVKKFKKLYHDIAGVREKKKDKTLYGLYNCFCIVPEIKEIERYLPLLMASDKKEIADRIINHLIELGIAKKKTERVDIFPIEIQGIPYIAGLFLNLAYIEKVLARARKSGVQRFGVLCFPWQREYYQAISVDIDTFIVDY